MHEKDAMVIDIVLPHGNEKQLLARAKKLGIKTLVCLSTQPATVDGCVLGIIAQPGKVQHAKKTASITAVFGSEQDLHVVEHEKPTLLINPEYGDRADHLHQRASGLNHILARACAKNNVTVCFTVAPLLKLSPAKRAQILGRISQNITICRQFRVPMKIATLAQTPEELRNPADLASLFILLGMHPAEAQNALGPLK